MVVEKLLDSDQVAEWLNIPRSTLDYWAYRGEGPKFVKVGAKRRYRPAAIEAFIASQEATRATVNQKA